MKCILNNFRRVDFNIFSYHGIGLKCILSHFRTDTQNFLQPWWIFKVHFESFQNIDLRLFSNHGVYLKCMVITFRSCTSDLAILSPAGAIYGSSIFWKAAFSYQFYTQLQNVFYTQKAAKGPHIWKIGCFLKLKLSGHPVCFWITLLSSTIGISLMSLKVK